MKPKHQRLTFFIISALMVIAALTLILRAFNQNLIFFYSPVDLVTQSIPPEKVIRVGGLVEAGSVAHPAADTIVFSITDMKASLKIQYKGIVPALFREGQGIIAEGKRQPDGSIVASQILAKHDEKYMPPEVAAALKKNGHWKDDYKKAKP